MDIWVKNVKTGACWILDDDSSKLVYKVGNKTIFNLKDISSFRFYPIDPRSIKPEIEDFGYQFSIFDFDFLDNM